MYIPDSYLEELIAADVPTIDLTTHVLGIGDEQGTMEYFTRNDAVLCGTEEAARIFKMLGCEVESYKPTGSKIKAGETFMTVKGCAAGLHMGWKCCLNIFEYYSSLATKTRKMVDAAKAGNPDCMVLTTRKSMPGTKFFDTKAIIAGGALPHRLGLSETLLVFEHHLTFYGGMDKFIQDIPAIKAHTSEKKLFAEASAQDAIRLAQAGIDGVQLDKLPVADLQELVPKLRSINPGLAIIAAGGVNVENAQAYAATGVNGLATTCLHFSKPLDMSVRMTRA